MGQEGRGPEEPLPSLLSAHHPVAAGAAWKVGDLCWDVGGPGQGLPREGLRSQEHAPQPWPETEVGLLTPPLLGQVSGDPGSRAPQSCAVLASVSYRCPTSCARVGQFCSPRAGGPPSWPRPWICASVGLCFVPWDQALGRRGRCTRPSLLPGPSSAVGPSDTELGGAGKDRKVDGRVGRPILARWLLPQVSVQAAWLHVRGARGL